MKFNESQYRIIVRSMRAAPWLTEPRTKHPACWHARPRLERCSAGDPSAHRQLPAPCLRAQRRVSHKSKRWLLSTDINLLPTDIQHAIAAWEWTPSLSSVALHCYDDAKIDVLYEMCISPCIPERFKADIDAVDLPDIRQLFTRVCHSLQCARRVRKEHSRACSAICGLSRDPIPKRNFSPHTCRTSWRRDRPMLLNFALRFAN